MNFKSENYTILIVDDDPKILFILERVIKKIKFNTLTTTSGIEALKLVAEKKVDLILLDVVMPKMNGYEVCRKIKGDPRYLDIPIIFITVLEKLDNKKEGFEAGGIDYITKPFEVEEVKLRLTTHLKTKLYEEELKELNVDLNNTFEQAAVGFVQVNMDNTIRKLNNKAAEISGYNQNEIVGSSSFEFLDNNCIEEIKEGSENLVKGDIKKFVQEFRLKNNNKWVKMTLSLIKDKLGKPDYYFGVFEDISEKKLAEKKLLESQKRFLDITKSMSDWIWEVNENFEYTFVSLRVERTLGYKSEELIGKTPFDFMDPSEKKKIQEEFLFLVEKKEALIDLENWNIAKDGTKVCFLTNGFPNFDENGKLIRYRGVNKDITKIKELTKELSLTINATTEGIWKWNFNKNEWYFSPNYYKMIGYEPNEFEASFENWVELIHPDDKDKALAKINEWVIEKKETDKNIFRVKTKDGEYIWIETKGRVVEWDENGKPIRMIGNHINVTSMKNAELELIKAKEKAEKANKAKSEFLSNMSHEIRTPMNHITGFLNLLLEIEQEEEKLEYLNIVKSSSNHLLEIINDILSISKIEAGKFRINEEIVNIYKKIDYMAKMFHKQANIKGLAFKLDIDRNLEKEILIDEHSILKILNNILANALKFTGRGYIKLSVKEIEDKRIEFIVKDTGIGINEKKQKHLYEPFEQGEHYLTKQYGGTGLGLAIVKKLVDLLNGEIFVKTEIGEGTEFKVIIPYKEVENRTIEDKEIKSEQWLRKKLRVISAEDVRINQKILEKIIKTKDMIFKKVYNGQELLDELEIEEYDVILMDIQMPILNGIDATKIIKAHQKYKDIPIIVVSAYAYGEDIEKFKKAGADDFVSKPVNQEELIEKINKWTK